MALGDITSLGDGDTYQVEVLASRTTTNSPPSGASAGVDMNLFRRSGDLPGDVMAKIVSTAGSVTMTVGIRVWGYDGTYWLPYPTGVIGTGTDATRGMLNSGVAIGEVTATDTIRYTEIIQYLPFFTRVYFEVTSIGGTSTAVTGFIVVRKRL